MFKTWCSKGILFFCLNSNGICTLNSQRDATYAMFFIIISALHVLGGIFAHHQELIKLSVQPWVLSCFPAATRWCEWVGTHPHQR
jgi:hypothetical protein